MDAAAPLPIPYAVGAAVALLLLAAVPIAGRIFLAWTPAGSPGGHAPRELPATLAASWLLGSLWFGWVGTVAPNGFGVAVAFAVPALALVARVLTSPAGLVPRHEPMLERARPIVRTCIAAAVIAAAVLAALQHAHGTWIRAGASGLAAAILVDAALASARADARVRLAASIAIAVVIANAPRGAGAAVDALLAASAFACGTVAWIRRGDRRGLALASAGVAWLVAFSPHGVLIAATAGSALVVASARPSRRRAAAWIAAAFVLGCLARLDVSLADSAGALIESDRMPIELALLAIVAAAHAAAFVLRRRGSAPAWNPSGAPESREAHVLTWSAIAAWILVAAWWTTLTGDHSVPAPTSPTTATWALFVVGAAIVLSRALERRTRAP